MSTVKDKVAACIKRHPDWGDNRITSAVRGSNVAMVHAIRGGAPASENKQPISLAAASGGFRLDGRRLYTSRPTDVWKARFFSLTSGLGYPVDSLSAQWGASEDSIRKHARSYNALRYAEDKSNPGVYIACVVHPSTPKGGSA